MKLSVCIIAKNEANHIGTVLESVKEADEIIVCDTGSTDNTVSIAKQYTSHVFTDYKWNDNFSKARNYAKSKATGDWILSIDADEALKTPISKIKRILDTTITKTVNCVLIGQNSPHRHHYPRLFKNQPDIYWEGACHECINVVENNIQDIVIEYGYSDAHKKDPERNLRILLNDVTQNPERIREKYYLAREYYYKSDYKTALLWYNRYIEVAQWKPEKADAYLMASRCLWQLHKGEEAREYCLRALAINANFKEALLFMAELSWQDNAEAWKQYATLANNKDVLFIRN